MLGKEHVICCHVMTSVTCFANCQNFSKLMWEFAGFLGKSKKWDTCGYSWHQHTYKAVAAIQTQRQNCLFGLLKTMWHEFVIYDMHKEGEKKMENYLEAQPSFRKNKSLTNREKNGMTTRWVSGSRLGAEKRQTASYTNYEQIETLYRGQDVWMSRKQN